MQKEPVDHMLEKLAPGSRLIRVISKLYTAADETRTQTYQKKIDFLQLRHSLCARAGRLELIGDLIANTGGQLSHREMKALKYLAADLERNRNGSAPFLNFTIDCLTLTIRRATARNTDTTSVNNGLPPVGKALLALSLSGLLVSACTQRKDSFGAYRSDAEPLPPAKSGLAPETTSESTAPADGTRPADRPVQPIYPSTYTVQKGDSIRSIAGRFKIDRKKLVNINGITYDRTRDWYVLYPGQVLILPGVYTAEAVAKKAQPVAPRENKAIDRLALKQSAKDNAYTYHLIQKGESLWTISKKYSVSIQHIAEANNIVRASKIIFGDTLKIPVSGTHAAQPAVAFHALSKAEKIAYLKNRTIKAGHPYLADLVDVAEQYNIDPRLYASLIWEESWFDADARSQDNCQRLAQLDPRFHTVTTNIRDNFVKSLRYLRHEFSYYRNKGFDMRSATLCALAAYNGGNTRIRRYIRDGRWDGKNIETIPLQETREHLHKVMRRCRNTYHAVL